MPQCLIFWKPLNCLEVEGERKKKKGKKRNMVFFILENIIRKK